MKEMTRPLSESKDKVHKDMVDEDEMSFIYVRFIVDECSTLTRKLST